MRGTGHTSAVLALLFVLLLLTQTAAAQEAPAPEPEYCAAPNVRTDVRPNPEGPPTEVSVGVRMVDLMGIDDISQTLNGDFAVILNWTDPRLAGFEGCEISIQKIWDPRVVFLNSGRKFPSLPEKATIGPGGNVRYVQRYGGTFATYHNLNDFPFDKQAFKIWLVGLDHPEDKVVFVGDEKVTGARDLLNISDWIVGEVSGSVDSLYADAYDDNFSRYTLEIQANRITAYYVWKVILPLCLIVAMSWAVFWINPAQFGPQIGLSATAMLTLIAFLFATTNMLPALGYFTILDLFIGGATILVFLAMLESLTTSYLVSREKVVLAERMDQICRLLFPLMFVGMVVAIFMS